MASKLNGVITYWGILGLQPSYKPFNVNTNFQRHPSPFHHLRGKFLTGGIGFTKTADLRPTRMLHCFISAPT